MWVLKFLVLAIGGLVLAHLLTSVVLCLFYWHALEWHGDEENDCDRDYSSLDYERHYWEAKKKKNNGRV